MVYVIINCAIAFFLFHTSFNLNTQNLKHENTLVNIVLLASGLSILMAIISGMALWGPERFTVFLEHSALFLFAVLYILISFFFLSCAFGTNAFLTALEVIFVLAALYPVVTKIEVVDSSKLIFASEKVFSGELAESFPLTWLQFYYGLFVFILPGFSLLTLMLYAENVESRLVFQRSLFFLGSLLLGLVGLSAIVLIAKVLPLYSLLFMLFVAASVVMLARAAVQDKIFDGLSIFSNFVFIIMRFALPALVGGFSFVALRPLYSDMRMLYFILVFLISFVMIFVAAALVKIVTKLSAFRSSNYGADFESDLAAIDYNDETADICAKFYSIFQNRVSVDKMKILIAGGNHELNTVFSSDGSSFTLSTQDPGLEVIRSEGLNVFLKEEIQANFTLQQKESEINAFMDKLEAETLIILNEGRHLIGVLALGEKRGGSSYDEYDKEVFDKLYSYFFVFGYYMSNIANASVVGTVNREIRMSAQIIKSIQENMDMVKNPKIDVGYLMVPAHNIGGEFVDLVRLTDTRHLLIIGAMSGKGISASMNMVILKSVIRTLLATTHDFKKLVSKINSFIHTGLPRGTFFAGVFCLVDFETDTLYYINCGIPAMLLYTRSFNNVIEIQGAGYVLGFAKDVTPLLKVKQMKLNPGDVLAITTAGIINSHSLRGDQYGKDNIKKSMTDNYMYDGMHMASFLFDDLKRFMAKDLDEDITVMMLRYLDKDTQTVSNLDEDEISAKAKVEEEVVHYKKADEVVLEAL